MKTFQVKMLRVLMNKGDKIRLAKQNYPTDDLEIERNIPYINDGDSFHLLDIIKPKEAPEDIPVLIDIHGGALLYGDKDLNRNFNYDIARRGFKVIAVSYRLIPEVTFVQQIEDIAAALNFVADNMEKYKLNLDKLTLEGDSAGGYLALFATALCSSEAFCRLFGVKKPALNVKSSVYISPMFYTKDRKDIVKPLEKMIFGGKPHPAEKYAFDAGRIAQDIPLPESFILTSEQDFIRNDAYGLKNAFDKAGVKYEFMDQPRVENYELGHVYPVTFPRYKESVWAIDRFCKLMRSSYE